MPFTDVCSTVSCWALILTVIFPPAHVLALGHISTPSHTHSQNKHLKDCGHHPYRISPSSAYSLTVYLDSTLHPFSASVSPTLLSPTPLSSSQASSPEKCSAHPLCRISRHTARAQGSVKRSHISTVLLPPSPQKQEMVHPFSTSSSTTRTTTPYASAQDNNQAHRPDRQKISDRNIIKKQTIYIANSNSKNDKKEQIPYVRVSKSQILRLIRHQSPTDQSSQQPQRQWSQILDVFWNRNTFQDTNTPVPQNDRHTRYHQQTQQQEEEQQERHDHADDSPLSDNDSNRITETEEEESGLWHGYVYPTGWNKSTINNDLFPLSGSIHKFPHSWPLRSSSFSPSSPLDIPWLALVECTLQTKHHLRLATQLGAKAVILYPSTTTSSSRKAEVVHCSSLLTATNAFGDSGVDTPSASVVPTLTLDALTAKDLLITLQVLGDTGFDIPATVTLADNIQVEEVFEDNKNEREDVSSNDSSSMNREKKRMDLSDSSGFVVVTAASSSSSTRMHSSSGASDSNSTGTTTTATDARQQQRAKELFLYSISNALKSGTLLAKGVLVRLGLDNGSVSKAAGGLVAIVTPTPKAESFSAASSSSSSAVAAKWVEKEDMGMVSTRFTPLSASGIKPDLIPTTGCVNGVLEQQQRQRGGGGRGLRSASSSSLAQVSNSPVPKSQLGEAGARGISTATATVVGSRSGPGGPAGIAAAALSMRQATAERISMRGVSRRTTTVPSGSNPSISIVGRLIQRIYAFSPSKLVQEMAILVKDDSMTGKLAMVLMSTICGVGVGMFGALLFVVALKVRVFQTRRRGGVEGRFGLNMQATAALQHQQQLREHGYKKVIPLGILESFGVQTVLHTSTSTMMTSKGDDDFHSKPRSCHNGDSSKNKLAYAEDVSEMEEGLQDLATRENSRRERERMRMTRTSSHLFPRTTPTGSSDHHHRRGPTAEWDSYFDGEEMEDITAYSSSMGYDRTAADEGETDADEDDGVVPDQASMDMERLAAAIMTSTRRGSYRRISLSRSSANETVEHAADGSTTTIRSTSVSTSISLALSSPQKHQGGCCGINSSHHHGDERKCPDNVRNLSGRVRSR
ncbi:hypothetical protein BG015_003472 [Linnemannia schmuckeri]|uniref:Uncharacterized protein n=1 Tax=Linnemannia schmuckeri TaxID=64567 RepID=A0A9P5VD51_9FUNG|nr:hypothetical protein BG015_003472 [Linnemannia schmuckeri]